ncbi:hypothetical protein Q2T94_14875 [Paeniglutamicibacter sulfureus]|uniref:hypothetical protein n=1 Tax=Paeniglutamicibacter sulfureus TaxID=43666 RepID=UPI0026654C7A|nr:hypothetical protein [Paeniglutamicibacter sulfureus]MDO2935591.1 hypothetical protein [Paeniglutamicibacter sulfureus]
MDNDDQLRCDWKALSPQPVQMVLTISPYYTLMVRIYEEKTYAPNPITTAMSAARPMFCHNTGMRGP